MTVTVERSVIRQQAAAMDNQPSFDPLAEFYGMWTTELADRYLPIPELPKAKYHCWDGYLFMTPPYEAAQNSYGEGELLSLLKPGARAAGYYVYGTVNLRLGAPNRWIQPDVTVLTRPERGVWVSNQDCLLVAEFISPSSQRQDRIDKPAACAVAGIPWYMTVILDADRGFAKVELNELVNGNYQVAASANAGQRLKISDPFEAEFDPAELIVG